MREFSGMAERCSRRVCLEPKPRRPAGTSATRRSAIPVAPGLAEATDQQRAAVRDSVPNGVSLAHGLARSMTHSPLVRAFDRIGRNLRR